MTLTPFWKYFLILIVLASLLYFWELGQGSLADFDEVIYAQMAREIVKSGDWFTMHLNGIPRFKKPPLYTWLTAASFKIFGIGEFGARFPSALFGVLGILATFFLGKELFKDEGTAFLGALILLTTIGYSLMPRQAMMSTTLTFFIILSLYFFSKAREKSRYLIFSGLSIGLAIMTKGVIGLIPLAIIGIFLIFKTTDTPRRCIEFIRDKNFYWGLLLLLLVASPWHLGQLLINKKDFLNMYIFDTLSEHTSGNLKNIGFYPLTLLYSFFPWTVLAFFALPRAFSGKKSSPILLLTWILLPLALFTFSGNRLYWHVVPLYPALSLLVAQFLREKKGFFTFSLALLIFSSALALTLGFINYKNPQLYKEYFSCVPVISVLIGGFCLSGILLLIYSLLAGRQAEKRRKSLFFGGITVIFISIFTFAFSVFHFLNAYDTNHNIKILGLKMRKLSSPSDKIIFYKGSSIPFLFYSDRFARRVDEEEGLAKILSSSEETFLLLKPEDFEVIKRRYPGMNFTTFKGEKDFFALANSGKPEKILAIKR
jgi:4-amino-4-deoxy-L-arabinose transferase-like glycosyltransferase